MTIKSLQHYRTNVNFLVDMKKSCPWCEKHKWIIIYGESNEILGYKCHFCGESTLLKVETEKIIDTTEIKIISEQIKEKDDKYKQILLTEPITPFKLTKLQKEIIYMLRVLNLNDRDLHTITIGLNPKYIRKKEYESQENFQNVILENLKVLKKVGLVKKQKKRLSKYNIEYELWSLDVLKFKEKKMTSLEKKILKFIDNETWDVNAPKTTIEINQLMEIQGRSKLKYINIRREILNFPKGSSGEFTYSEILFNRALNILKERELITGKVECNVFTGLTCTREGHDLAIN